MKTIQMAMTMILLACVAQAATYNVYISPFDGDTVERVTWVGRRGGTVVSNTVTSLSSVQTLSVDSGSSFRFEATPKTGYENPRFAVLALNGGGVVASNAYTTTWSGVVNAPSLQILEAKASPREFTVRFDTVLSGAYVPFSSKTVVYDSTYGDLPVATRAGYDFGGWWTERVGGTEILSTTDVDILREQTLYGHWTAKTYTVSFDEQGVTSSGTPSRQVVFGEAMPGITPPTATGYAFGGYYKDAACANERYYNPDGSSAQTWDVPSDTTLYAKWSPIGYVVTFDGNGGSPSSVTRSVPFGAPYELPTEPTRTGYSFAGWWTAVSGGTRVTAESVNDTAADQTLYARWNATIYKVTFSMNDDSFTPQTATRSLAFGSEYEFPNTPTYTGHVFNGWWTSARGGDPVVEGDTVAIAQDHDLYAHWLTNTYTVVFDAGDARATGAMEAQPMTYGVATRLADCAFAKKGYDFLGWTNAVGAAFGDGATVSNLTTTADDTVTLFARWSPHTYDLVLDAGGEGGFTNGLATIRIPVTVDEPYGELPVVTNVSPEKTSYEWRYQRYGAWLSFTNTVVLPVASGVTNLVATWEATVPSLAKALDAEGLTFEVENSDCTTNWFSLPDSTAFNGSCAAATFDWNEVTNGTTIAILKTTVTGPGRISFNCSVQSPEGTWRTPDGTTDFQRSYESFRFGVGNGDKPEDFKIGLAASDGKWVCVTNNVDGTSAVEGSLGWTNLTYQVEVEPGQETTLYWMFRNTARNDVSSVGTARVDNVVWFPASSTNENHVHHWSYKPSQENGTITAICDAKEGIGSCPYQSLRPQVTLSVTNQVYTGESAEVQVVTNGWFPVEWTSVVYRRDSDVEVGSPRDVGDYTAVLSASSAAVLIDFTIAAQDLSKATVSLSADELPRTGLAQTVTVDAVKMGGRPLQRGTDYEVSGDLTATAVGTYSVQIDGRGNYAGTKTVTWSIVKSEEEVAAEENFAGIGSVDFVDGVLTVTLTNAPTGTLSLAGDLGDIVLDLNGQTLQGTDGTAVEPNGRPAIVIAASAGTKPTRLTLAGTGTVAGGAGVSGVVSGTGGLAVEPSDRLLEAAETVEVRDGANGVAWTAALPAVVGDLVYQGAELEGVTGGVHVVISGVVRAVDAGSFQALVTPQTGFAWNDGATNGIPLAWSIGAASLSNAVVTLSAVEVIDTGVARTVSVQSVQLGGRTLVAGADYVVTGSVSAQGIGEYVVMVNGQVNYEGQSSATWRIVEHPGLQAAQTALGSVADVEVQTDGTLKAMVTKPIAAPLEIPDDLGPITLDLNGRSLVGAEGVSAIRIVAGVGSDGSATQLVLANSGAAVQVQGGRGASAIEVATTREGVSAKVAPEAEKSIRVIDDGAAPVLSKDDNAGEPVVDTVKNTYVGWLEDVEARVVRGQATYQLGVANKKTGLVKISAKVFDPATRKTLKLKGSCAAGADGTRTVDLFAGKTFCGTVTFQGDSVVGELVVNGRALKAHGGRLADKKRDAAKYASLGAYVGAWTGVLGEGGESAVLALKIAKAGKVTATAYLPDGTKLSGGTQLVEGEEGWAAIPVALAKKSKAGMCTVCGVYWIRRAGGEVQWSLSEMESFEGGRCTVAKAVVAAAAVNLVAWDLETQAEIGPVEKPKFAFTAANGQVKGSFKVNQLDAKGRPAAKSVKVFAVESQGNIRGFGVCKGLDAMGVQAPVD